MSNYFFILEIITFAFTSYTFIPFSYTYILILLRLKSIIARGKPILSIYNKLNYNSKRSNLILNGL
jgi:hypothetical protein